MWFYPIIRTIRVLILLGITIYNIYFLKSILDFINNIKVLFMQIIPLIFICNRQ